MISAVPNKDEVEYLSHLVYKTNMSLANIARLMRYLGDRRTQAQITRNLARAVHGQIKPPEELRLVIKMIADGHTPGSFPPEGFDQEGRR